MSKILEYSERWPRLRLYELKRCLTRLSSITTPERVLNYDGFVIRGQDADWRGTKPALYTAYVSDIGFSTYRAIPGTGSSENLEIADEKALAVKQPLDLAVEAIRADLARLSGEVGA